MTVRELDCHHRLEIPWKDVNVPSYWGDLWGTVSCINCNKEIELDEYDYD